MLDLPETIPPAFWQGINQFNQGEFYACHDTLEAIWMEAQEPEKTFYQGILQIAVSLYHLSNQNWRGSCILLGEGISKLSYYQPVFCDINIAEFLQDSQNLLTALQISGPDHIAKFQPLLTAEIVDNLKLPKICLN